MSDNVILIGYRGSGKSSVARHLGQKLNRPVISTDACIEKEVGPIENYIKRHSWRHFRAVEHSIIQGLRPEKAVIDCGGGVVERADNIVILQSLGMIFWLKAPAEALRQRLRDSNNRPSLSGEKNYLDEIPDILARREPHYRAAADYIIDTQGKSIEIVTAEIIEHLNR